MDFKLIWTERAISDLADIVHYYRRELQSPEAGRKVGSAIIDRVEILRLFPDIGPRYPKKDGIHRQVYCYDYRIFYRADRASRIVYIVRVWHGRQDLAALEL